MDPHTVRSTSLTSRRRRVTVREDETDGGDVVAKQVLGDVDEAREDSDDEMPRDDADDGRDEYYKNDYGLRIGEDEEGDAYTLGVWAEWGTQQMDMYDRKCL